MSVLRYAAWDRTTRIFHWVNALCIFLLAAVGTAILNGGKLGLSTEGKVLLKTIHVLIGYAFVANLLWRLVWGFVGGRYARWRHILPWGRGFGAALGAELRALRGGPTVNYVGHSPLGRIAVSVIVVVLFVQSCTGLVLAGTDIYYPPFGRQVAEFIKGEGLTADDVKPYRLETMNPAARRQMLDARAPFADIHANNYYLILLLIVIHIAAVVFKENKQDGAIVSAMFSGYKSFEIKPVDSNDGDSGSPAR